MTMKEPKKLLIAGVGGQGVIFLTNVITEAALTGGIPCASSELHGLAQRRGSVVAGITFGENSYGYIEKGGADFLVGLEPLEAQRCLPFLNLDSRVIIDDNQIYPHSVTVGKVSYPDVDALVTYLRDNMKQVIYNHHFNSVLKPVLRNLFILGRATRFDGFPLSQNEIEKSIGIVAREKYKADSLEAFRMGRSYVED